MNAGLLEQLRAYGDDFIAAQQEIRLEDLGDRGMDRVRHRGRRAWVVALAAAIVVVILVGGALLLIGSDEPPVVTKPAPTWESWQRVSPDVMDPAVGLFDLAETGSGLMAVGHDPADDFRQEGVVFVSDDGLTWTRTSDDDPALTTGTVLVYSIASGGGGVVAVGMSCEDALPCGEGPFPTVWTSEDGTDWTRSPDPSGTPGAMEAVAVTDHGMVAVGWITGSAADGAVWASPAVWLSPDGADWSRVWEGDRRWGGDPWVGDPIPALNTLTVGADGLIVAAGSAANAGGELVAAVWTSTDARTWQRVDPDTPAFGGGADPQRVWIDDLAWGSGGFIAVGNQGGSQAAVLHSPDGRAWTRTDIADQPIGSSESLGAVTALRSGYVAAGPGWGDFGDAPVTLWTSADGSTWDQVGSLGPGSAHAIVVTSRGIVVAGQAITGGPADGGYRGAVWPGADDFHASVWAGPALDPTSPPPNDQ